VSSKTAKCIAHPGLQLGSRSLTKELFQRWFTLHACACNFICITYLKLTFLVILFYCPIGRRIFIYAELKCMQLIYINKLGFVK